MTLEVEQIGKVDHSQFTHCNSGSSDDIEDNFTYFEAC